MHIPGFNRLHNLIRKLLRAITGTEEFYGYTTRFVQFEGEAASDVMNEALRAQAPSMIARFGRTEACCIADYLNPMSWSSVGSLARGKISHIGWRNDIGFEMTMLSGFFPSDKASLSRFAELMLADMRELDVLGSWLAEEAFVNDRFPRAKKVRLRMLEPFWSVNPWTKHLKGKKVLVVHPFEATIRHQYSRRELLFQNPDILPQFDLQIIKAVQSIVGNKVEFSSWFDALDFLKSEISKRDFDVAILGCGAYGFPLAAHIKRMGKKSIHMGGATQLLFGIKGARWDSIPGYGPLYNENWIRPLPVDVPRDYKKAEGGSYW
jgi:hypothetical protein